MVGKENEILHLMKTLDISREEAEKHWEDEKNDYESYEMKEMAEKAENNGLLKVGARQAEPSKEKKIRERKPNEDKRFLIDCLFDSLKDFDNCEIVNPERQIDFWLNGIHYSATLTAHRAPKKNG